MTIEYRTENCRRCGRLKSIRVAVSGSGAEYHSICDDCGRAELREKGREGAAE